MEVRSAVLVTGAGGFVGRNICSYLEHHHRVVGLTRCWNQYEPTADFIEADICNPLPPRPDLIGCRVVHCAGVMRSGDNDEFSRVNVLGTKNVLDWCLKHQVSQIIFFSTGGIYGYQQSLTRETDIPAPIGVYGQSKLLAENLCFSYGVVGKLSVVIFRLYFPFGPNQSTGIFQNIKQSVLSGGALNIVENGAPIITPIHVSDVSTAVERVLLADPDNGIFNVCGSTAYSFLEIVRLYEQKFGISAILQKSDEVRSNLQGSNALLTKKYGWQPRHDFKNWFINYEG